MSYDALGLIDQVRQAITCKTVTLTRLSQQLRVERHTLERTTRQSTAKSFRQLRDEVLFRRTQEFLIQYPNLSIKEVAFKLGPGSVRTFDRLVSRTSGLTPLQLREKLLSR